MTFAEFMMLVAAVMGLTFLMRPLQRRLEAYFLKLFSPERKRTGGGRVIDVTDYSKGKGEPEA